MYQLWVLGALDNVGELTPVGLKMANFPHGTVPRQDAYRRYRLQMFRRDAHHRLDVVSSLSVLPTTAASRRE